MIGRIHDDSGMIVAHWELPRTSLTIDGGVPAIYDSARGFPTKNMGISKVLKILIQSRSLGIHHSKISQPSQMLHVWNMYNYIYHDLSPKVPSSVGIHIQHHGSHPAMVFSDSRCSHGLCSHGLELESRPVLVLWCPV